MPKPNFRIDQADGRIYSYGTVIWQTMPDGATVQNITHYSPTTIRHQKCLPAAQYRVSDVPLGTLDLTAAYEQLRADYALLNELGYAA